MPDTITIVVLDGDETGQELLEQSIRVLDPGLLGLDLELDRFDLSLQNRRATSNQIVADAAAAMRRAGLGLKAATITPAARMSARVYGEPKWTVSPIYEGMLKEELDAAAARHPDIDYRPVLIDATYAGLLSGATDAPLVIPALNRDGDCLSDLVLPMFGSIADAESVLLAFDEDYDTTVAMAEAPHGTAPALLGKDVANPLAMILACAAVLHHAADRHGPQAEVCSRAIRDAVMETVASGTKTPDLGGHAGTTEFTTAVLERVRTQVEAASPLRLTA
jgi:isocitrate dehydrogenase (NAD+)